MVPAAVDGQRDPAVPARHQLRLGYAVHGAATVTQGVNETPVTVAVGGGDAVLFLPDTGATVTATVTGPWSVTVTGGTVPSGEKFHLVTMDVPDGRRPRR